MAKESTEEPGGEKLLDWAWSQWKTYRNWQNADKNIAPPSDEQDESRLLFEVQPDASFFIGVTPQSSALKVGLVTRDRWLNEGIEQAILDSGGTMTEFLEDEMESDEELSFPMLHRHDSGSFYFYSEIPFDSLDSPELYHSLGTYFKGYVIAFESRLSAK